MFPGEPDGAEHRQRIEQQFGSRSDGHDGGSRGGQLALLRRFVDGAHRVPRCRRGQFAVDKQHRRFVLKRLEGADGLAELLPRAQVCGHRIHGPSQCSGRSACRQRDGDVPRRIVVDTVEHQRIRYVVAIEMQDPDVDGEVGAITRLDRRCDGRIDDEPQRLAIVALRGRQDHTGRAHPEDVARRPGDPPSTVGGGRAQVAGSRQCDGGRTPRQRDRSAACRQPARSSPTESTTAPVITVGSSGPGSRAVAAASMTQAASASEPPCPPTASGRCTA